MAQLIKHLRADIRQRATILKQAQQDALRDKADARPDARVIIKPNQKS